MNTRLHDEQRQSWTISSFFLRVPRRVRTWLPQCGQASGCLVVSGTRAMRGMEPYAGGTLTVPQAHENRKMLERECARKLEARRMRIGRGVAHGFRQAERSAGRGVERAG